MNEAIKRIKDILLARGLTNLYISKKLNISAQTVGHWLTMRNQIPPARFDQLAKLLEVSPVFLHYGIENTDHDFIPILESHQIKDWLEKPDERESTTFSLEMITENHDSFAFEVRGDGMVSSTHPEKVILPGEIVIIDTHSLPTSGEIVLVEADGDYKIRQYLLDGREIYLVPFNPMFERSKLENTEKIKGVIVQKIRYYHSPKFRKPLSREG